MQDDDKLLTQYARDGSQAAFGQLVARHLSLVYSTCLRELGSPPLAEDAAQVVFLLLARKARSLRAGPSLAGWLYKAARFVAKDVRKQEGRRRSGEERVMSEVTYRPEPFTPECPSMGSVEPFLNDALSALKAGEREAILLRFIEGHTLAETGAALGVSEDAARMRVSRAVEKMRRHLTAHGAAVTGIVLTGLLASDAARPVPANAAAITQATLQALSTGPAANVLLLSKGVYQTVNIIKVKVAALAAAVLLVGAAIVPITHAHPPKHRTRPYVPTRAPLPDTPQTVLSLLNKAQTAADVGKTMTADFSYVVSNPDGSLRKDVGTFKLMKPNYAAITYNTGLPTATELHSDGRTVWTYHPAKDSYQQVEADPQGKNINVWRLITIGGFFSVYTWIRRGVYAEPGELHYRGRETMGGVEYEVLEHKMVGTVKGGAVPFDQKIYIGADNLIHRFTLDFVLDGKPGREVAELTNIRMREPMQPTEFAYNPPPGASLQPK